MLLEQLEDEREYLLRMRDHYERDIEFVDKQITSLDYKINRVRREMSEA